MWGPEKDRTDIVKGVEVDDVAALGALAPERGVRVRKVLWRSYCPAAC